MNRVALRRTMVAMTPAAKPMPRAAEGDRVIGTCVDVADDDAVDVEDRLGKLVGDSVIIAGIVAVDVAMVDGITRLMHAAEEIFVSAVLGFYRYFNAGPVCLHEQNGGPTGHRMVDVIKPDGIGSRTRPPRVTLPRATEGG
jgi:hypothetical protein